MKTIGFANKFYTLWEVSKPYRVYINEYQFYMRTDFTYYKNLSFDLEKAKKKMSDSKYNIDLNLKGSSSWSFEDKDNVKFDRSKVSDKAVPFDIKQLKNYKGRNIMWLGENESEIKALWTMYLKKDIWNNEVETHSFKNLNPHWVRPCVYARRRLIELGIIERFDGQYVTENYKHILIKKKEMAQLKNGHHFENKQRVELELKELHVNSFDSEWGRTYIVKYESKCGKLFTYMGGSPKWLNQDDFTKIKATTKHDEYKSQKQTKLQRIKIV